MPTQYQYSYKDSERGTEFTGQIIEPSTAQLARKFIPRLFTILQSGRLHNSIAFASVSSIGLLSTGKNPGWILLYTFAWVIVFMGIYFINDYFDAPIDAVNKPWKPVPSGRVNPHFLYTIGVLFLFMGGIAVVASLPFVSITMWMGSIAAISVVYLGFEYSRWIKRKCPIFGDIVISITIAICFLLPWVSGTASLEPLYLVSFPIYTVALLGREYLKDLEDYEADIACKRNTLPHSYGIRTTYNVATLLIIFSFFWSLIVAYTLVSQGGLRFTFFLSLTTVSMFYLYKKNISKAQGWMKVALLGHLLIDMLYWNTNYYV